MERAITGWSTQKIYPSSQKETIEDLENQEDHAAVIPWVVPQTEACLDCQYPQAYSRIPTSRLLV